MSKRRCLVASCKTGCFLLTDLLVRKSNRGRTDKVLSCPAVIACCVFSVNQVTLIEIQI